MNFRHLLLFSALALAACNGSDSSTSRTDTDAGTFTNAGGTTGDAGTSNPLAEVQTLVTAGKVEDAVKLIRDKGLQESGAGILTEAGYVEAAYSVYAPEDYVLNDATVYSGALGASLPAAVDERPAVKRHSMELDGKTIWYTASAGHLTAYANTREKQKPQASIFYTAYTRDDLPKADRPVTFFFNGVLLNQGNRQGASSMYLHMGSFAPKRVVIPGPKVPPEWAIEPPKSFPLEDDKESLIDKTDLVFVDIVPGSGYSQAIAPKTNASFHGIEVDVELSRQFVTRYVNANNRQASPKYLYGEAYAGGTRLPKLARALLAMGTIDYEKDPSGATPKVLTGVVFQSPEFIGGWDEGFNEWLPALAMAADAMGVPRGREPGQSLEDYAESIREFLRTDIAAAIAAPRVSMGALDPLFLDSPAGKKYASNMLKFVGDKADPKYVGDITIGMILPWFASHSMYDARMHPPSPPPYDFNYYDDPAITKAVNDLLPDFVGYHANSPYIGAPRIVKWEIRSTPNRMTDILAALRIDPSLKLLAVHGYYDEAAPFITTENQLKAVVLDAAENFTLLDRIPVKNFEGGHRTYYSEDARAPLKKTLAEFYDAPPYGSGAPSGLPANKLFVAAPSPVVALH